MCAIVLACSFLWCFEDRIFFFWLLLQRNDLAISKCCTSEEWAPSLLRCLSGMARGCLGDGGQQVPGGSWHGWRRASCMCLHVQTLPWVSSHAVTEVSEQAVYQRASFPPLLLLPLSLFRSVSLTSGTSDFPTPNIPPLYQSSRTGLTEVPPKNFFKSPILSVQQNWSYRSKKKLTFKSPTLSVRQNWSYRSTEKPFFKSPTLSVQQNWSYRSTAVSYTHLTLPTKTLV